MKPKPILFNTPMVQAILDGRKTQTRRVMAKQPIYDFCFEQNGEWFWTERDTDDDMMGWWPSYENGLKPRHKVGDIVYVRETWAHGCMGGYIYKAGHEYAELLQKHKQWRPSIHMPREAARIFLHVTDVRVERLQTISHLDCLAEGVRVDSDMGDTLRELDRAVRESRMPPGTAADAGHLATVNLYQKLWNTLNAKRGHGWDANPWVWVYTFERVEEEH